MADPQVPVAPAIPPKPFKVSRWLIGAGIVFALVYIVLSFVHLGAPAAVKDKSQPQVTAAPATQSDMESFIRMREERMRELAKKRDVIREELQKSGLKDEAALVAIVNQLPPCDQAERQKLNGQNYAAVNQQTAQVVQFACESDDAWHPLPAQVADIQPATAQQERAMMTGARPGVGDGMSKKERAAEALKAALASSSVVDFAAPEAAAGPSPVAVAAPSFSAPAPAAVEEKKNKYGWDTYTGPLYRVFEGDVIEGILTNRLAGEFTGPVSVMVTTNLYSRDRQHILMPQGTRILGEAQKVGVNGQRRLAVPFHRAIMPDGYSVDVDQFAGLEQQGASGLTGRVDTHWPKVIATAVMVGAIGGLSEVGASGTALGGLSSIRLGVTQQTGQEATQILNRALNILPTVTVYEGTRVRIWVQRDMQLPAYENHTVSPTL
jgi:type IV secretion system protein VirB10